ncbi:MAG: class I SAM-dependent methyltransferase [Microgenomates group bacterium]|nr:class I SAM-dependent methyltransferase [Microgenomates group bacterium]
MKKTKQKQWWQLRYGTKKGVAGYLNTYSDILDDFISQQEVQTMINFLKNYQFSLSSQTPILDGFCGNCRHSKQLVLKGFKNITAFDWSKEMLTIAEKNLNSHRRQVVLFKEDGRDLTFSTNLFDLYFVLGNSAFGFFDNPKDDLKVALEACRVIKPAGVFIFDLVDYDYVVNQLNNHVFESVENGIRVIRKRKTFQHNGLLKTGHEEIRFHQDRIDRQIIGRWVYTNQQVVNLLNKAGFDEIYFKKEAFCYDKYSDKYGTMGVRNLFLATKNGSKKKGR